MPPFFPRKRSTPPPSHRQPPAKKAKLADVLDTHETKKRTANIPRKTFLVGSDAESESSLSDVDSDQFEDVDFNGEDIGPGQHTKGSEIEHESTDEDEDVDWEDAAPAQSAGHKQPSIPHLANGPIQITLCKEDEQEIEYSAAARGIKKGPSRREKQARIDAHKMHVQFLLWHNAIRNSWAEDKTVQQTLLRQLPQPILKEVDKWKRASGLMPQEPAGKHGPKKSDKRKNKTRNNTQGRQDWGSRSQPLESGKPDLSHGDPLISLMKVLAAYWKKRFAITAPGLRKRGYDTKIGLKKYINSYRTDSHDPEKFGEKIKDLSEFRKIAERCEGSRDVGAQLFTALVRALGLEARLVVSLQPVGFGWTKAEQILTHTRDSGDIMANADKTSNSQKGKGKGKALGTSALEPATDSADTSNAEESDSGSVVDVTVPMPKQRPQRYDRDLAFPIYWTEAVSPITNKIIAVSPLVLENTVATSAESMSAFEPRGAKADRVHQIIAYVVAYSRDGSAKDVTVRYIRKGLWPGRTKGFRLPLEKIPVYDNRGKLRRYEEYDWFKHILGVYRKSPHLRNAVDDIEDSTDLVPAEPDTKKGPGVDTLQSLKASQDFVLERFLRREEALKLGAKPNRMFVSGKGDNLKEEPVYLRADVERCLTAESWHKEGRRPKLGETPMKMVPVRAVTLTRKREAEEHERIYGEKQMQGLYSWDQSEWIIPEPIIDGVIPKNGYGNMDCFVPSMVPEGAIHIPLKGTVRICKRLEIDFAEAVTGFEFGNKRAVPVCTGVVVAKENERMVKEAWQVYNEEQKRKEETKMENLVLDLWKKFVIGLRIRERISEQYGEQLDLDIHAKGLDASDPINIEGDDDDNDDDVNNTVTPQDAGGFIPEEDEDEFGGGFLIAHEDDASEAGELIMEEDESVPARDNAGQTAHYPMRAPIPVTKDTMMIVEASDNIDPKGSEFSDVGSSASENSDGNESCEQMYMVDSDRQIAARAFKTKQTSALSSNGKSERQDAETSENDNHSVDVQRYTKLLSQTDSDNVQGQSNATVKEMDDDHDEEPEIYTLRATRRPREAAAKNSLPVAAKKSKTRRSASRNSTNAVDLVDVDDGSPKVERGSRKGRQREAKRRAARATNEVDEAKNSTRKSKRISTLLRSPYFDSSD